jgi:hypothetical protein
MATDHPGGFQQRGEEDWDIDGTTEPLRSVLWKGQGTTAYHVLSPAGEETIEFLPKFVSVSLSPEARDALRAHAKEHGGQTLSEAVIELTTPPEDPNAKWIEKTPHDDGEEVRVSFEGVYEKDGVLVSLWQANRVATMVRTPNKLYIYVFDIVSGEMVHSYHKDRP